MTKMLKVLVPFVFLLNVGDPFLLLPGVSSVRSLSRRFHLQNVDAGWYVHAPGIGGVYDDGTLQAVFLLGLAEFIKNPSGRHPVSDERWCRRSLW